MGIEKGIIYSVTASSDRCKSMTHICIFYLVTTANYDAFGFGSTEGAVQLFGLHTTDFAIVFLSPVRLLMQPLIKCATYNANKVIFGKRNLKATRRRCGAYKFESR